MLNRFSHPGAQHQNILGRGFLVVFLSRGELQRINPQKGDQEKGNDKQEMVSYLPRAYSMRVGVGLEQQHSTELLRRMRTKQTVRRRRAFGVTGVTGMVCSGEFLLLPSPFPSSLCFNTSPVGQATQGISQIWELHYYGPRCRQQVWKEIDTYLRREP